MFNTLHTVGTNFQTGFLHHFTFFGLNYILSAWVVVLLTLIAILLVSYGCFFIINNYFLELIQKFTLKKYPLIGQSFFSFRVFHRLVHIIPALIIYASVDLLVIVPSSYSLNIVHVFKSLAIVYMILSIVSAISASLNVFESHYKNLRIDNRRSIKGYIQAIKIILFMITSILIISILINKSPLYLLTSIGAIAAVILMVFKDQIMGFAANTQIAATDLVRLSDRIEVPQYGVDGNVIEISLSRIKVRNLDNTISSIPAFALLSNGVKNWRGILETGGRRIKRSIDIDINSIKFFNDIIFMNLKNLGLISDHLYQKFKIEYSRIGDLSIPYTNLEIFRFYLQYYIDQHPKLNHKMNNVIRYLATTPTGIPIEIYVFTNETNWVDYEKVQAEIFDHIFAVVPYFQLAVFQQPSGTAIKEIPKNSELFPLER